ncbi:AAA family ATPase [Microbacterium sp. NPDC079995]|uniref:AAA family ATPase n=1 Tax=unclassified Microbacterium TaxID=2609290 RepID=UPI00344BDBE0
MSTGSEPARAFAHVSGGSARFTTLDGVDQVLDAVDADGVRRLIVDRVRADAAATGIPVELHTSGDRGEHLLVIDPSGDIDVEVDDRTVTRAELRQQAWWTTDPAPADEEDAGAEDEQDAAVVEPAGEPGLVDEVPAFFPASPTPGDETDDRAPVFDSGDDDDLDDDEAPAEWAPARVTEIPAAAPATETGPVDVARESFDAEDDAVPEPEPAPEPDATPEPDETPEPDSQPELESAAESEPATAEAAPSPETPFEGSAADGARPSFIEPPTNHPAQVTGWRSFFVRLGIKIPPSKAELERAERERTVSRQWAGCRAIAVANGKGGVGKTMTTAVLSAVFARHGGGNVLAWDNNDTRGTLGWRTEQGDYDTTIRDLLPEATRLLEATASVSDIARFVHHQSVDRYDVLRSNPELLAADQRITTADFDLLAQVAARYYRMVIFDSGNDESADRWLRMIDSAHQLVVPTLAAPESAESAALLLDALRKRDEHSRRLADGAVVVVGQSERAGIGAAQRIAAGFEGHVRAVEIIPFDDALKAGRIRYDALQSRTKDAWMRAAAAVADGL